MVIFSEGRGDRDEEGAREDFQGLQILFLDLAAECMNIRDDEPVSCTFSFCSPLT